MPNRLADETSPYLLQHAGNPVNWYPWGDEAFELARAEQKPVFLSIGYSACHWCHVMAHESFEDRQIAQRLNDYFVPIKVDREERPDVDQVYMEAAELAGSRRRLLEIRAKRAGPARDDKILASWNGLMIEALARAGATLGEPRYCEAAGAAADFLLTHLRDARGRLLHTWRNGRARCSWPWTRARARRRKW